MRRSPAPHPVIGTLFLAALLAGAVGATAQEQGSSQMTVGVQPPPPPPPVVQPTWPWAYPPSAYVPPPRKTKRCEQDRLLTDQTPCDDDANRLAPGR
ncbi:MAG TPA: hypothetical protein VNQ31_04685 [Sphingomonadaceae bacterium]|nr:hypothetical protein [Sphingomonadaceae bacterium]